MLRLEFIILTRQYYNYRKSSHSAMKKSIEKESFCNGFLPSPPLTMACKALGSGLMSLSSSANSIFIFFTPDILEFDSQFLLPPAPFLRLSNLVSPFLGNVSPALNLFCLFVQICV